MGSSDIDMGGLNLICNTVKVGATEAGDAGTDLTSDNLGFLNVTAGTVSASKAVVVDANKDIASLRDVTLRKVIMSSGGYIDLDSTTATLSSNAATITHYACVVTTESLTTAAGASQALTITLTGVAAGDLAFVTRAGGTNTRRSYNYDAVTTTDTVTVTVYNNEPTNALNGTLKFNLLVMKA